MVATTAQKVPPAGWRQWLRPPGCILNSRISVDYNTTLALQSSEALRFKFSSKKAKEAMTVRSKGVVA